MLDALAKWFRGLGAGAASERSTPEDEARLAAVALMVEVVRADFEVGAEEQRMLAEIVERELGVSTGHVDEFLARAEAAATESVGLYGFTKAINEGMGRADKLLILGWLWRLVYADGRKDMHEEHMVRRIADLLLLTHTDFVETRLAVEAARRGGEKGTT